MSNRHQEITDLLLGDQFVHFGFGEFNITVQLVRSRLNIVSDWLVTGPDGAEIDRSMELSERKDWKLWMLARKVIAKVTISDTNPVQMRMETEDGWALTLYGSLSGYEDWQLWELNGSHSFTCEGVIL